MFCVGVFQSTYAITIGVQPQERRHKTMAARMLPRRIATNEFSRVGACAQLKRHMSMGTRGLRENQGGYTDKNPEGTGSLYFPVEAES